MREARGDAALFESTGLGSVNAVNGDGAARSGPGPSPWPSVPVHGELARARREWLHTNGAGAYASSTLAGMHTRRYHGLLVAALDPPRGRHVYLSHVDATILRPRGSGPSPSSRPNSRPTWELAKHQFPGVDPEGGKPLYLQRFDQDPLPRWTYAAAGGELEVTLALVRGENALVLRYQWRGPHPVELSLRPLIAARNFHNLQREHGGMLQRVELRPPSPDSNPGLRAEQAPLTSGASGTPIPSSGRGTHTLGEMRIQPRRELPRLCFRYEGTFVGSPDWWRRFEYLAEHERGLDFEEDLWTPGVFEVPLDESPTWLVAAVERLPEGDPEDLLEAARDALLAEDPGPAVSLPTRRLTIAAETFRADLARKPGVIAGYPWYEVWSRDALIALPGLYLVQNRVDGALRILRELIRHMADGLVPSRFPEPPAAPTGHGAPAGGATAPEYGSADATLWLFEAVRHVADILGDGHPVVTDELLLALHDAFEATLRGTRNGIHLTEAGLLAAGKPGDTLTWMNARVKGRAVTSRAGCPIELSALWARGCDTLARLARAAGDTALHARAVAECRRTRAAVRDRFWCDATAYPYDVVSELPDGSLDGERSFRDASVRPNAVLALAVDPACFTDERARLLLDRARRELVTPAGLRTLAPSDPRYLGRYGGSVDARDGACHQGAVFPWLLGFYARAALRAGTEDRASIERLATAAARTDLGFGLVSELAEGDAPHHPGGGVAHALSVAELLRVLAWDAPRTT